MESKRRVRQVGELKTINVQLMNATEDLSVPEVTPSVSGSDSADVSEPRVPHQDFCLEVTTHHASKFKAILESLKAVLTECSITFHPDTGLRMTAVDSKGVCAAFLALEPDFFDFYACSERQVVGVDVALLHKLIKAQKANDSLSFLVRRDARDKLIVVIENASHFNRAKHELTIMRLDDHYELKRSFDFTNCPAQVDSSYFQSVCRSLHSVGETEIAIRDYGNRLVFSGLRSSCRSEYEISVYSDTNVEASEYETPLEGTFSLRYMTSFTKSANNLARRVKILLADEGFLIIDYVLDNDPQSRNSLRYILFPVDDQA
ncbi:hypothetical protein GGF32_003827 [Allomyces javanicus]|nr:hypothetical protein GGF32_003827 [Allomyces javanicus]